MGAIIPLSYFCMFKLFHNKMFFEKYKCSYVVIHMESIDIKKRDFFFFCGKLFTIHRWMKKQL